MHVLQSTKGRIVFKPPRGIFAEFFEPGVITQRTAFELKKSMVKDSFFEVAHDFKLDVSG